jgi:hypothetical protein
LKVPDGVWMVLFWPTIVDQADLGVVEEPRLLLADALGRGKKPISLKLNVLYAKNVGPGFLPLGVHSDSGAMPCRLADTRPLHAAGAYIWRRRRAAVIEKDVRLQTFVVDRGFWGEAQRL